MDDEDDDTKSNEVLRALVAADLVSVGWCSLTGDFFFYLDEQQQQLMDEVDDSPWADY